MSLLTRRRMMLANQRAESQFEPFPVSPWTLNSTITSDGREVINQPSYAKYGAVCQTFYPVNSTDQFTRTSPQTDSGGVNLALWVHEYSAANKNGWLRRTYVASSDVFTPGANCAYIKFTLAYASSSGKKMTQAIIDEYFAVSKKEG